MFVTIMMTVVTILMKWAAVSNNVNRIQNYSAIEVKISGTDNNTCFFLTSILRSVDF